MPSSGIVQNRQREESKGGQLETVPKIHILQSGRKIVAAESDSERKATSTQNLDQYLWLRRDQCWVVFFKLRKVCQYFRGHGGFPSSWCFYLEDEFVLDALNIVYKVRGKHICRVTGHLVKTKDPWGNYWPCREWCFVNAHLIDYASLFGSLFNVTLWLCGCQECWTLSHACNFAYLISC